jgi:hypothetical protein
MAEIEKEQTQDAFREGLFVRALGWACSTNPHPPNSDEHILWEKGWWLIDTHRESLHRQTPHFALLPRFLNVTTVGARPPLA